MRITLTKIHHPRLLLLLLLVIGSVAAAACVTVDDSVDSAGDRPSQSPVSSTLPPLSESDELAADGSDRSGFTFAEFPVPPTIPIPQSDEVTALNIVREAGLIDKITGDQPWTASTVYRTDIAGSSNAVAFTISWDDPIESSGPWRNIQCRGTRIFEAAFTWSNVHMARVTVDLEKGRVIGTGVRAPYPGDEQYTKPVPLDSFDDPDILIKVYDLETGRALYEGTLDGMPDDLKVCPPGFEDD